MTTETPLARRLASPTEVSTIKPILRKPTPLLGVKRRSDDDDEDTCFQLQSSPTKKRKTVMFNESLNVVREISSKSLDEAKTEVRKALEGHARGIDGDYDNLKEVFVPPRIKRYGGDDEESNEDEDEEGTKAEDLLVYVVALTSLAPLIGKKCSGLIKNVLRCSWLERDDNFARAYIQLMAALSSVQGSYFAQVLSMMVDKFSLVKGVSVPVKGFAQVDEETRKQRLHLGLRYLLELFPAGGKIILNLVESKFPYTEDSKAVHMEYIDHLLRLKIDRPELERDILVLILARLVKIDVEMTVDLENDDDETAQEVMKLLEGNNDEDDSDAESELSDDEDNDEARRIKIYKSKAETMDAILDLLFSIYTPIFEDPDSPEAIEAFQDLLSDFSNVILPVCVS
jgi:RNA polymerase I-specific transcription initiation factor RRN3